MKSLRFVCPFATLLILLIAAPFNHTVHANQLNALPDAQRRHAAAAAQPAAALPPIDFGEPVPYSVGGLGAGSLAVADVNGDGKPDLVVAGTPQCYPSCEPSALSVLLGNGDGTFQTAVTYSSGGYGYSSVAVGDVNGDGHPDLVVANFCQSGNCPEGGVSVLLGNGNGTFQAPVSYSSGEDNATSVAIGDVNGDGHPDLVVTQQCSKFFCGLSPVSVLLGNGNGTFQAAVSYHSGGRFGISVAIGDVNGDGKPDLVVANYTQSCCSEHGEVSVLLGKGDGTFGTPLSYRSGGSEAVSVAIGDVDGNGHPDLIVTNRYHSCCWGYGTLSVFLGNGDGTFQTPVIYKTGGSDASSEAIADVNGDGHPDLVVANQTCHSSTCHDGGVSVLLGNGDGTFQAPVTYDVSDSTAIAVADVNGDGRPDLLVSCNFNNCTGGAVAVLLNRFPSTTTVTSSPQPSIYGQTVTLTATVSSGAPKTPTGTVTFKRANTTLGKATLNASGVATLARKTLPAGVDVITAVYNGDTESARSTSAVLQTVQKAVTGTTISSSLNPSTQGQTVTFAAKVTSPTTIPTGTVTFMDGSTALATVTLAGGKAAYNTSTLTSGSHNMTAVYNGTPNITGSTSPNLVQTVN